MNTDWAWSREATILLPLLWPLPPYFWPDSRPPWASVASSIKRGKTELHAKIPCRVEILTPLFPWHRLNEEDRGNLEAVPVESRRYSQVPNSVGQHQAHYMDFFSFIYLFFSLHIPGKRSVSLDIFN